MLSQELLQLLANENTPNDRSKIKQMSGEWSTALSLVLNEGTLIKSESFPKGTKCIISGKPMDKAQFLVDKARGGNYTRHNVIPVCNAHARSSTPHPWDAVDKWKESYTDAEIAIIEAHTGSDHKARLNPYLDAINAVSHRKRILQTVIEDFMNATLEEIYAIHRSSNK